MYVLVTYDIATTPPEGRRRLARIARACLNVGQRVQHSVFECKVDPGQFASLKHQLLDIFHPASDSIRFYFLGNNWQRRVEHHGAKPTWDIEGPLIA